MSLEVALWVLRGGGTSVNGCLLAGGLSTDAGQRDSGASEGSTKSSGNLLPISISPSSKYLMLLFHRADGKIHYFTNKQ